ncbi:MAG TPA: energy-coupling factor transporter transmembrane component T [Candidatus Limnocylindrales bacterium]|jgi:energy-coupling factor transport system permease protein
MMLRAEPEAAALASPLGRVSPLTKLGIAFAWFVGLALTTAIGPPIALTLVVLAAAVMFGRVHPGRLVRGLAPLWTAALAVGVLNVVLGAANLDPAAREVFRAGPLRVTEPGLLAGLGVVARVLAIAAIGVVFSQTTDPTRFVDALVQQARVSPRFAYGALAAYQAVPRFGEDLASLRQARRIRGLRGSWHPRLLVGLLVLAIRHGDRLAVAMDARGFGSGPRTHYREVRWVVLDLVLVVLAAGILWLAMGLAG